MGLGYLAAELRKKGVKTLMIDARLMGLDVMQTVETAANVFCAHASYKPDIFSISRIDHAANLRFAATQICQPYYRGGLYALGRL